MRINSLQELDLSKNSISQIDTNFNLPNLEELDISFTSGWAKNTHEEAFKGKGGHGVVAHIGTNNPDQPCIM